MNIVGRCIDVKQFPSVDFVSLLETMPHELLYEGGSVRAAVTRHMREFPKGLVHIWFVSSRQMYYSLANDENSFTLVINFRSLADATRVFAPFFKKNNSIETFIRRVRV